MRIWNRRMTLSSVIYAINRYSTLLGYTVFLFLITIDFKFTYQVSHPAFSLLHK